MKLASGDVCLGGQPVSKNVPSITVETKDGKRMEFRRTKYEAVDRGGKGFKALRRTSFVRVIPPPIQLVDWDAVEAKNPRIRPATHE